MHTIGFYHEQQRPDRDEYLTINYQNIIPGKIIIPKNSKDFNYLLNLGWDFAFNVETNTKTFDLPYDYYSIMHYHSTAFSVDGKLETMVPKQDGVVLLPTWEKADDKLLSPTDIKAVQIFYNCAQTEPTTTTKKPTTTTKKPTTTTKKPTTTTKKRTTTTKKKTTTRRRN
jgi:hypothetical protein